ACQKQRRITNDGLNQTACRGLPALPPAHRVGSAFVCRACHSVRAAVRHSLFGFRHLLHPFTFPIGVNRATGLLIPANSVAAITSSMSLYAAPASSASPAHDVLRT